MNCLLLGYGEIGKGIKEVYERYNNFDIIDPKIKSKKTLDKYDIMCVAIPHSNDFIDIVNGFAEQFEINSVIIFSTVPVGTTAQINNAVHVPIEGKHPDLAKSIKKWQVFMGGKNKTAYEFFINANKLVYQLDKPEFTEFLKLQSTTNYGLMIEYARYVNECCGKIGMDYNEVLVFNQAYNNLYREMGMPRFQRYILTAPEGAKGGHCVTPNSKILKKQFPNKIIDIVSEEE